MRLHPITTIKEWIEMMRYASPLELVGCVLGIVMTIVTYVFILVFFASLVLGIYAIANGYGY